MSAAVSEYDLAGGELVSFLELLVGYRPEQMVFGGGDDLAVDHEILEVDHEILELVVMDPDVGDFACDAFAGLGVSGDNSVADLDVLDRLLRLVGHEHESGAAEGAETCPRCRSAHAVCDNT